MYQTNLESDEFGLQEKERELYLRQTQLWYFFHAEVVWKCGLFLLLWFRSAVTEDDITNIKTFRPVKNKTVASIASSSLSPCDCCCYMYYSLLSMVNYFWVIHIPTHTVFVPTEHCLRCTFLAERSRLLPWKEELGPLIQTLLAKKKPPYRTIAWTPQPNMTDRAVSSEAD